MTIIFDFLRTIYDPENEELFPGVIAMLENLEKKHNLVLITRDEVDRRERMKDLSLDRFFDQVVFVKNKSKKEFVRYIKTSEKVVIVGDRKEDEIAIGNSLGCITVHVKQGIFAEDRPDIIPTHSINKIGELIKITKAYEK